MIRVRGVAISDEHARDLIRRLAKEPAAADLVARIRRTLDADGGLIATSQTEAGLLITAVDFLLDRCPDERLLELRASLAAMRSA